MSQDRSSGAAPGGRPDVAALAERYRRALHVHCYRMLASYEDAEDAVQETFLRAWRARDTFDPRRPLRPWLYRIATNVCMDVLRRRSHPVAEGNELGAVAAPPSRTRGTHQGEGDGLRSLHLVERMTCWPYNLAHATGGWRANPSRRMR